jgi:hypothetical protein
MEMLSLQAVMALPDLLAMDMVYPMSGSISGRATS